MKITRLFNFACSFGHLTQFHALCKDRFQSGFSLIELLVATGIVSILASVALPNYINFTKDGKISYALTTLLNLSTQMEKNYLDLRNYGNGTNCAVATPTNDNYVFNCSSTGQDYIWTATSKDSNYKYTINQNGLKSTKKFNGASLTNKACWVLTDVGSCY